jgi:tRNA(Ile)-lysidine synthase
MDLEKAFIAYIRKEHLFPVPGKCLIALSGGVDSVVLASLCKVSDIPFGIAHVNFKLRADESDRDEAFVIRLGKQWEVETFTCSFDTRSFAKQNQLGIQEAARQLRYNWFESLMDSKDANGYQYLLTAHHADDNAETLLMNFFKGTGIEGLQGIFPRGSKLMSQLVRPLLFAEKKQLIDYAEQHQLEWREDASNESSKYLRNFLRNEVIPLIQQHIPSLQQNLMGNISRFREVHTLYSAYIDHLRKQLLFEKHGEMMLPVRKLLKTPALQTVLMDLLKPYGFSPAQIPDIIQLLQGISGKYVDALTFRIFRNRQWLVITAIESKSAQHFLINANMASIEYGGGKLQLQELPYKQQLTALPEVAELHSSELKFPLLLRKWKQGDYFYPLGMRKKKKLSRFLIDQKRSMSEKENTWVLCSENRIVWIVGMRIDDRFKITDHTLTMWRIRWSPPE